MENREITPGTNVVTIGEAYPAAPYVYPYSANSSNNPTGRGHIFESVPKAFGWDTPPTMSVTTGQIHQRSLPTPTPMQLEPIRISDGSLAVPVYLVYSTKEYNEEERSRAEGLNMRWNPKAASGSSSYVQQEQLQRCPAIWVDQLIMIAMPGSSELHLVLGEFNKRDTVNGKSTLLHGLVIAGGGHVECMSGARRGLGLEPGHMSLIEALNNEILEEINVKKSDVVLTRALTVLTDVFNDPRRAGHRYVFGRLIKATPKASDELKNLYLIPLSQLGALISREGGITNKAGEKLQLILSHDNALRTLFELPNVIRFLCECTQLCGLPGPMIPRR